MTCEFEGQEIQKINQSNGRTGGGGERGGLNCVSHFVTLGINKLWDNYEGCDLISSFSRAMLTSPSPRQSFLSAEAKDELPPSLYLCAVEQGSRWDRRPGLTGTEG